MNTIKLTTPLSLETVRSLKAGDRVLLSGVIWTGRDQAHKRLVALLVAANAKALVVASRPTRLLVVRDERIPFLPHDLFASLTFFAN